MSSIFLRKNLKTFLSSTLRLRFLFFFGHSSSIVVLQKRVFKRVSLNWFPRLCECLGGSNMSVQSVRCIVCSLYIYIYVYIYIYIYICVRFFSRLVLVLFPNDGVSKPDIIRFGQFWPVIRYDQIWTDLTRHENT